MATPSLNGLNKYFFSNLPHKPFFNNRNSPFVPHNVRLPQYSRENDDEKNPVRKGVAGSYLEYLLSGKRTPASFRKGSGLKA